MPFQAASFGRPKRCTQSQLSAPGLAVSTPSSHVTPYVSEANRVRHAVNPAGLEDLLLLGCWAGGLLLMHLEQQQGGADLGDLDAGR